MAIAIEPPENAIGLDPRFEHWSYRTQPEGQASGPGDLDLIVYSLRRYCELALKGSPTVLLPLFAPPEHTLICTELGEDLRAQADVFLIASNARDSFLGYLETQRRSLLDKNKSRNREVSDEHWLRHEVRNARSPSRLPGPRTPPQQDDHPPDS